MEIYGYIYLVRNRANGKLYVGQTIQTIKGRWAGHKRRANSGSTFPLHNAIRKHGSDSFDVIELGRAFSKDELDEMECRAIWTNESTDPEYGYNLMSGGGSLGNHSEETKAKMSVAKKGTTRGPRTDETRERVSASMCGRKQSPEHIANAIAGRHKNMSEETRTKCSAAAKLRWDKYRADKALETVAA